MINHVLSKYSNKEHDYKEKRVLETSDIAKACLILTKQISKI